MFPQTPIPDPPLGESYTPSLEELLSMTSLFEDDESRWTAVQTRDQCADGFFIYAVKSTKIYCRPICKGRVARRANITFYHTAEQARKDGFRACKRCKPDSAGFMPEEAAISKIRAFVAEQNDPHNEQSMTLGQMAKQTGLSKWHFHRVFKKIVGVTPVEYFQLKKEVTSMPTIYHRPTSPGDLLLSSQTCRLESLIADESEVIPSYPFVEPPPPLPQTTYLGSHASSFSEDLFTTAVGDIWNAFELSGGMEAEPEL